MVFERRLIQPRDHSACEGVAGADERGTNINRPNQITRQLLRQVSKGCWG
jgi:hypothetical protein